VNVARARAALVLVFGLILAACGATPGPDKDQSDVATFGRNGPSAQFQWNAGTGMLKFVVTPPKKLTPGWCVDAIFVWRFDKPRTKAGADYYDPRLVRSCNDQRLPHAFIDAPGGLRGLKMAAVCYGPEDYTNATESQCRMSAMSPPQAITDITSVKTNLSDLTNDCIRAYAVEADGTVLLGINGGDPTTCSKG
jgi:hypothetical protein